MAISKFNLAPNQRAERKTLIHVIEWQDAQGRIYVLQESEPLDWDTNFTAYYTKDGDTYTAVTGTTAPTWAASTYYTRVNRSFLGTRTPDSSVEYNPDIETSTDIRGFNYTDVNKTQPSQSFDPHLILGGDRFGEKLNDIRKRNAITELSQFTVYIITAFVGDATSGYEAERHVNCTVQYDSIGGEDNVNFPFTINYSNILTTGLVDKITGEDFTFTPDVNV